MLLQNATAILLQNATEVYYKMRQVFYYKMRQLLQNATILLQNATVITKCDIYYKLRQYNQLQKIWNHEHDSMQIMHVLYKLILSTSKMAEGAKQKCALVERNCVLFYVIIVLRDGNQARSELFSKIF